MSPSAARRSGPTLFGFLRGVAAVAIVVIGVAVLLGRRAQTLPPGQLAPEFALPRLNGAGGTFRLSDHRGGPVVIEVMASWCGACRQAAPTVNAAHIAERARPVRFVAVTIDDDPDEAAKVARATPFDLVQADRAFMDAYRVQLVPTFIVVDESGNVRHMSTGAPSRRGLESWLSDVGAPVR